MWFVTAIITMGLVVTTQANAVAPQLSIEQRLSLMSAEEQVDFAIASMIPDPKEAACAKKIAYKESRYNVDARNKKSGAQGAWQLMWGKPDWSVLKQISEANDYVIHRYETWCEAYRFHQERNWY